MCIVNSQKDLLSAKDSHDYVTCLPEVLPLGGNSRKLCFSSAVIHVRLS